MVNLAPDRVTLLRKSIPVDLDQRFSTFLYIRTTKNQIHYHQGQPASTRATLRNGQIIFLLTRKITLSDIFIVLFESMKYGSNFTFFFIFVINRDENHRFVRGQL